MVVQKLVTEIIKGTQVKGLVTALHAVVLMAATVSPNTDYRPTGQDGNDFVRDQNAIWNLSTYKRHGSAFRCSRTRILNVCKHNAPIPCPPGEHVKQFRFRIGAL